MLHTILVKVLWNFLRTWNSQYCLQDPIRKYIYFRRPGVGANALHDTESYFHAIDLWDNLQILSYLIINLDTTLLRVNYFLQLLKAETLIQDMYQWVKGKIISYYQLCDYLFCFKSIPRSSQAGCAEVKWNT